MNATMHLVEIVFYPADFPHIKAYYLLSQEEYDELCGMFEDIHLPEFMNGEALTSDNCEVNTYSKPENVKAIKAFLQTCGNPCDLLERIKTLHAASQSSSESEVPLSPDSDDMVNTIQSIADILRASNKAAPRPMLVQLIGSAPDSVKDDEDVRELALG